MDDIMGIIYCLVILTVCASEMGIALALTVAFYRLQGSINVDFINYLKNI